MTYGEIFSEFCNITQMKTGIEDYRPCDEMFDVPFIPNAIVIWLTNGAKIIYIAKDNSK